MSNAIIRYCLCQWRMGSALASWRTDSVPTTPAPFTELTDASTPPPRRRTLIPTDLFFLKPIVAKARVLRPAKRAGQSAATGQPEPAAQTTTVYSCRLTAICSWLQP